MISIFPHETFSSLADAVADTRPDVASGPVPHPVIVPSLQFGDLLQSSLADRCGICMGLDFIMPRTFIHRVMKGPESRTDSDWSKRRMVWRIFPFVPDFENELGLGAAEPRDRLALAEQVADRFDQYGHFRPDLIRRWAAGKSAGEDPTAEDWQRNLWKNLRRTTNEPHPAERMELARNNPGILREFARRFPRLHVVGTGSLDPLLVEVLGLLDAAGSEIQAHVILPTLAFLGDLQRRGALPSTDAALDEIGPPAIHPLLPAMGRHAVGSFLLLGRLDENYGGWPVETGQATPASKSLLSRLQSDIRDLRAPQPLPHSPSDCSISIHSCYGARREMETVRDEILRAFSDIDGLNPSDIHIVSTSLEDYRPFISAVLQQTAQSGSAGLPVRITEASPADGNPIIEGLLALLGLAAGGRFSASDLIELLQLRAVQTVLAIEEAGPKGEFLRAWIEETGLTRGLAGKDTPGSWTHARDRLIAGRFFGHETPARYPDGQFILPLTSDLESGGDLRDRFVAWHAALEETLRAWSSEPASASAWAERLQAACAALLGGDGESLLEVQPHLDFLARVDCPEQIGASAVLDWLAGDTGGGGRRTSPWGGILCGRIKQLQNLPCRVLIMTGFHDGPFPARGGEPPWDLLRRDPRAWDRNPRVDDRQQFLDALLTPTDRLVITASTLNPRTLKQAPLSSCVDELLRVLEEMGASRKHLVVHHPLQPFSPSCFTGDDGIPQSFDTVGAAVAESLRRPDRTKGILFWKGGVRPKDEAASEQNLDARSLTRFWKGPASAFVRACDVFLPEAESGDESLDRLPLEPDSLSRWILKEAVIRELLAEAPNLDRLQAELTGRRLLPSGALGEKIWSQLCAEAGVMGRAIRSDMGETLNITTSSGTPPTTITARVELTMDGSHLLVWRTGDLSRPEHFLGPWIHAVVAAAGGRIMPSKIITQDGSILLKEAIPREEATALLEHLLEGMRRGSLEPLCYSPGLTHQYLKAIEKGANDDLALADAAAKCGWTEEAPLHKSSDLPKAADLLAWRDRDPLAHSASWREWMEKIARPLAVWGGF